MTRHEFDTMLRFKAQAGIVPLVAWVRELAEEYIFNSPIGRRAVSAESPKSTGAN